MILLEQLENNSTYFDSNIKSIYISENKNTYNYPIIFSLMSMEPINIITNIYIGNIFNASNWSNILKYNFDYIINFNSKIKNFFPTTNIKFFTLDLKPNLDNIEEIIEQINLLESKINLKNKNKSNILLFSLAGNNTPCVIMICYLIIKYNYDFKNALIYVCKKFPNYNIKKKYFNIIKSKFLQ